MQKNTLTVFANFRIDSEERLLRMKDSFASFCGAKIFQWVINIRGKLRQEACDFLKKQLGSNLKLYELESPQGWFYDSRKMLNVIDTEYVLVWVEDHICTCGVKNLNEVVDDIVSNSVDYIGYSWYGLGAFRREFDGLKIIVGRSIDFVYYNFTSNKKRQKNCMKLIGSKTYIVSLQGIFSLKLFNSILTSNKPIIPRWPKETPFDFEKRWDDTQILPLKYGVPQFEIFSAIDDDNKHPGSSLISRKLYPARVLRPVNRIPNRSWLIKNLSRLPLVSATWIFINRLSYFFPRR